MNFFDKFDKLCVENGKKKTPVCVDLGLSNSAWIRWRNGAIPEAKTMRRIADYFGVPVAYLTDDTLEHIPEEGNSDALEIREAMRTRPGIKLLFDVLKDAPDSDLYETLALAMRLKEQSKHR